MKLYYDFYKQDVILQVSNVAFSRRYPLNMVVRLFYVLSIMYYLFDIVMFLAELGFNFKSRCLHSIRSEKSKLQTFRIPIVPDSVIQRPQLLLKLRQLFALNHFDVLQVLLPFV